MRYGIYDKKTHLLLERNLAQDTTFAMIDELMLDYPEDWARFAIVKEVDQGWICTMTMRLVPVHNLKDVLDSNRYSRVVSAVEFLIKEKGAVSATTSCGVTVGRGRIPK
jgi:hypothetical protein